MGWTFVDNRPRGMSNTEWFAREWGERFSERVVDLASPTLGETYVAYRRPSDDKVECLVILTHFVRDGSFGYKDLDESMGIGLDRCPQRILELLSPVTELWPDDPRSQMASEFRDACWARIYRRAERRLRSGDFVRFPSGLRFSDGVMRDLFRYELVQVSGSGRRVRRERFYPVYASGGIATRPVRIPGWRDLDFEVVAPPVRVSG